MLKRLILFTMMALMVLPVLPAVGQGGNDDFCIDLIQDAIAPLEDLCNRLDRNAACYGHNRVDATFWQEQEGLIFSQPSDRVPLRELQMLATAPLDVSSELWGLALMNLQADLPGTLPGQAVTFLLMGDVTLENDVAPEEAVEPVTPVAATTLVASNLRSRPTTNANVVVSVPFDTELQLIGVNAAGDWYQVMMEDGLGRLWISAWLVDILEPEGMDALPVTAGPGVEPRYGPMQAFYFTTGRGIPTCTEAPDALVVQTNQAAEVTLRINDLDVSIGSTVVFMLVDMPNMEGGALIMSLLEGDLRTTINGVPVHLGRIGDTLAVTVGDDGTVDENTEIVQLSDPRIVALILAAARNADESGVFDYQILPRGLRELFLHYFSPPPPPPPPGGSTGNGGPGGQGGTGSWGTCGSCDSCGYAASECVRSPDGQCLWDPSSCRVSSSRVLTASNKTCYYYETTYSVVRYNPPDSSELTYPFNISSSNRNVTQLWVEPINSNTVWAGFTCTGTPGSTSVVTVSLAVTNGKTYTTSFTVEIKGAAGTIGG
jgi:hypothetical protein